jgi:hypothetical protein
MNLTDLRVLRESLHHRKVKSPMLLQHLCRQVLTGLIDGNSKHSIQMILYPRNRLLGKLGHKIMHLMDQTPLPQALGSHLPGRSVETGSCIRGDGTRGLEFSPQHISQKLSPMLIRLFIAQHQVKQNTMSLLRNAPSDRDPFLGPLIELHRLVDGIQKQIKKPLRPLWPNASYSFHMAPVISLRHCETPCH